MATFQQKAKLLQGLMTGEVAYTGPFYVSVDLTRHNIDRTLLRYKMGSSGWQKMPCYISWLHARITMDGAVRPCTRCDLSFGNLKNNSFREI